MSKQRSPEVVVVTGSSGGVGRAIAHAFAKRGAHIGLLARGEQGLSEAVAEVKGFGGKAIAVPTDVADHEAVEAAAARVEEAFGPIDIWINDAMATVFARVVDTEPEEFKRATEVTYLGAVYGTMAALKRMVPRDHGTIVQVGSALAYRSDPAAGGVLRIKVRDPRLHRLDSHRAAARQEQRAHHDGPAPGGQYNPVQLVSLQAA